MKRAAALLLTTAALVAPALALAAPASAGCVSVTPNGAPVCVPLLDHVPSPTEVKHTVQNILP